MTRCLAALLCCFCLTLTSCGSSGGETLTAAPPSVTSKAPAPAPETEPAPANPAPKETTGPLQAGNELVTWVDKINIRSEPNTKGKVVAAIPNGEPMTFTGDKSSNVDAIMLRSTLYQEPWLKVKTKDGQEGWVFGGAVKRPNEQKGNQVITATNLDFPYFGRYDLSEWKELDTTNESGGDAENTTKRYQKGAQIMVLSETDMGDYGYHYTWQLTDVENKVLLERKLSFQADMDMLLTEAVTNHIETPAVEYQRSEKLAKHPVQLGGRPLLVSGEWAKREL